ncbi:ankyrin repeat domain-containing protein [Actinoplanes solisilvae]|uniref:ankyrin repeat domain-containing protein n=1 Tax=Actinoplanes solisilvae TaxID=2486853 RepID=UPI000FD84CA6|nr:ankyrin repeat domain-containing protein [Actinoplanes solisilvae]
MNEAADHDLIEAVRAGDKAAVERALADGADPDAAVDRRRASVLIEAARGGRLGIVRALVEAGASVGPFGQFGVSPLRVAMLQAHADVAEHLIAHGALPLEPTRRTSLLTEAVTYTRHRPRPAALAMLRVLLEAGATPLPGEETPLITAVMQPVAPAVLRLLFAQGADADQLRSDGTPAIVVAARRGDHAAVDTLLLAGADVNAGDRQGRTALMHAVERNEQRVIAVLREAGAAVDTVSADGMTALRLAQGWHRQNVQFMLGEMRVGMDDVPIVRTVVRISPVGVRLAGDPPMFRLMASVIDVVLDDLGDDEWAVRSGSSTETARAVAQRFRDDIAPGLHASWFELEVTAHEFAAARSALLELAYGTTPGGVSRLEIVDLLEEIERQLGR